MRLRSRRPALMTPVRWVVLTLSLLLVCFLLFNMWYRTIHKEVWAEERAVAERAVEAAQLTEIGQVDKHVWDTTTWIVQGTDTDDNQVFVWLDDENIDIVSAAEGISEEMLQERIAADNPEFDLIRTMPGMMNGQKVWEVYYSVDGSPRRYFYRFYRFDNGQLITTYNLPNRFAGSVSDEDGPR
ncbi:DUF5590 domain-containing protein [Paenibacillus sp. 1P07SE]|uniref:cell wall elongation regulator TseB-like domain-containing protein n=1 Tax=Paenibacillus sp. 1P07SE TaxID=3132209 RepID=UPI0039A6FCA5